MTETTKTVPISMRIGEAKDGERPVSLLAGEEVVSKAVVAPDVDTAAAFEDLLAAAVRNATVRGGGAL